MAVKRESRARKRRATPERIRRPRSEAEQTLSAIRNGEVDALVVAGPTGDTTLTIEGATHPYFILLNAMSDGAALLEPSGSILFGNRKLGEIAGEHPDAMSGSSFQKLFAAVERDSVKELLRDGCRETTGGEFAIVAPKGPATPVAVTISRLPLENHFGGARLRAGPGATVLMAIIIDLTYQRATELTRTRLLERLISAEDDERRRIARELHDETGQSLAALLVGLRAVADMAMSNDARVAALRLREVAANTITDVGRLARGLHPAVLDDKGLIAAASRCVSDYSDAHGTTVNFAAGAVCTPRLEPLVAATMFRILQEALTNVARHAKATRIDVELTRDGSGLRLLVKDNGAGFDVVRARDGSGLGLRGMRERVTLLGGSISFESARKRGTSVRAHIPIASATRRQRRASSGAAQ
jgi:signal transduction histidine kinase